MNHESLISFQQFMCDPCCLYPLHVDCMRLDSDVKKADNAITMHRQRNAKPES